MSSVLCAGNVVVDNDGLHGTISAAGDVDLTEGTHKIELFYFKRAGGDPVLKLQWGGGPHKLKRQIFPLKPNWDTLRTSPVEASCELHAPNTNHVRSCHASLVKHSTPRI